MSPDPGSPFTRSDAALRALRPAVPTTTPLAADAPATVGNFLHGTLRPILKLQNDLLLRAVADFVGDHHIKLASSALVDQQCLLVELLGRNTKLRYTVVGLITALFTSEEYAFYRQHRSELNRRLLALAQRRVLDQVTKLIGLLA